MVASPRVQHYFKHINKKVEGAFAIASRARSKGFDPEDFVEVSLARNMAERVVGLISVIAPQIVGSGVVERIMELEKKYASLDWRVALKIAEEVALEKFCKFKDKKEAIEVGIRTGFAYHTVGVVSSPLDGIVSIDIKKRMDGGGEYFCVSFAGPIRNAGGTAAAVSVLITDYVRKIFGYGVYDPQEVELKRAMIEMQDYRDKVAPRQYFPSWEEHEFLMTHLPVEVGGEPSEKIEVSNYKDLPRIPTNMIRSGFSLLMTECLPLKAPKLWKQLSVWGKDFGLEHWFFLEEFLKIQKAQKAKGVGGKKEVTAGISPDYTFLHDLVAGRPVLSHPLRHGGLRLRYGRSRTSGFSSCAVHPAMMFLVNGYLATGTQIKIERPSKGSALTCCDCIDGPVVKFKDGSVVMVDSLKMAKECAGNVVEILYLGDFLVSYGDFFNRAHTLVPAGYCEEWWVQEVARVVLRDGLDVVASKVGLEASCIEACIKNPFQHVSGEVALVLARKGGVPLHPRFTFFWSVLSVEQLCGLLEWVGKGSVVRGAGGVERIVLPFFVEPKRFLELLAVPHSVVSNEFVVIEKEFAGVVSASLGIDVASVDEVVAQVKGMNDVSVLGVVNTLSGLVIRDKAGTFIGARMGRPEKAKMRKLTGSPHVLFPVGNEGGKYRSFQSALAKGRVVADFPNYVCSACQRETVFRVCELCGARTVKLFYCKKCGWIKEKVCVQHGIAGVYLEREVKIGPLFSAMVKQIGMRTFPDLIKGVRGTSNKEHVPEHLAKGVLRAKYDVFVNKDGTTRYDMTQLPMTHFTPQEIGASVEILKELGYEKDIHGAALVSGGQVVELLPQDVVLPECDVSLEEGAGSVLVRVGKFIDDLLVSVYGEKPFYQFKDARDVVGQLVLCLAPHTSAAMVARVIGFSKTQGFFAHPLIHAATRRDCDGDEACVVLLMDAFLNFSKMYLPNSRGSTMDAPLVLTTVITPSEVDDMAFDLDVDWQYSLELYEAALQYKMPWEVKVKQLKSLLNTEGQYEGLGFTHEAGDVNEVVRCSAYKTLPSMEEKLLGQMDIAEKIRAVDTSDVARLVIEKHFLKDLKGNLRKFSSQEFRCVDCNEKYRRPPLAGCCLECRGKLIFTISEGSVLKYLEPAMSLGRKYNVSPYLQQTLLVLQRQIESVFGKEKETQVGLGAWFG